MHPTRIIPAKPASLEIVERERERERLRELDRRREREIERERERVRRGEQADLGRLAPQYGDTARISQKDDRRRREPPSHRSSHGFPESKRHRSFSSMKAPMKEEQIKQTPLDELLQAKAPEDKPIEKPKFLTKAEREKLALERLDSRREEETKQRASQTAVRRTEMLQRFEEPLAKNREQELLLIKNAYRGVGENKRKANYVKASDKYKVSLSWDLTDDTSHDLNPLYDRKHEAAFMFGRGQRGGFDPDEQRRQRIEHERRMLEQQEALVRTSGASVVIGPDSAQVIKERPRSVKDMHWSEKPRKAMSKRDWRILREDFEIFTKGTDVPLPLRSWEDSSLSPELLEAIRKAGYSKPTPIQRQAIPIGLKCRDIVGIAETGSGKTAAFVLPMLEFLRLMPSMSANPDLGNEGPYALIMAPTRELAIQIEKETRKFAEPAGFHVIATVGGQSIDDQAAEIRSTWHEVCVATPGRLHDLLKRRLIVLNQCTYIVLDEADRMIDMGFEPQVQGILDALPLSNIKNEDMTSEAKEERRLRKYRDAFGRKLVDDEDIPTAEEEPDDDETYEERVARAHGRQYRQTAMFTATMPESVSNLIAKYLRNPITVIVGGTMKVAENVRQEVLWLKQKDRVGRLRDLIREHPPPILVFCNSQKGAEALGYELGRVGPRVGVLHGGRSQDQRESMLDSFRNKTTGVLIATDVMGRGIDVKGVELVVNYEMPSNIESYCHRIGRTGRAGRKGVAVSFMTNKDEEIAFELHKLLKTSDAAIPSELTKAAATHKPGAVLDKHGREQVIDG